MTKKQSTLAFLIIITAVALYFCYLLAVPFYKPILTSVVLAIVFYPAHARIRRWIGYRNVAAALSTTLVILLVGSLVFFLGRAVVSGLHETYESLGASEQGRQRLSLFVVHLFDWAVAWVSRYSPITTPDLQKAILAQTERVVATLISLTGSALGSLTSLFPNILIGFFVLFFLFRDGRSMLRRVAPILPIPRNHAIRLFQCLRDTLNAIVYGTLAMAAIQGALTGIAFWILAFASPVLWGVVTTLCALLPVIGTTFVLLPATAMLFFTGHWVKGLILLVWALVVVHPVDNILRPYLIGNRTRLSTLYIFFALLGGLRAFGALGLFIGPVVLALTVALLELLHETQRPGVNGTRIGPGARVK